MSVDLRRQIEEFYLPRQLVETILEFGEIPAKTEEVEVGVGFIDVVDYTFLSKFLTPKENQEVLNGLYTAFNSVLRRRGGYLNKIEGDSLMFQYDSIINTKARGISDSGELRSYIARELFFTCVEMQRVSVLFNNADLQFLDDSATPEDHEMLQRAFAIIQRLRSDDAVANPLAAMFQVRIRIGANLGEAQIGNFGPKGARQWDVIGMPVIDAKRMESTAPVGGLRISRVYYDVLVQNGIIDEYYEQFRTEARAAGSRYAEIERDELFLLKRVVLREKSNACYETCSIQVNPSLPEQIAAQVRALITFGRYGVDRIAELIKYYRGNRYVIDAVEDELTGIGVQLRRSEAYQLMSSKQFTSRLRQCGNDRDALESALSKQLSLYDLLQMLGRFQDVIGRAETDKQVVPYSSYPDYVSSVREERLENYRTSKAATERRMYFHSVVFPLVFASISAAILEYQASTEDLEVLRSSNSAETIAE